MDSVGLGGAEVAIRGLLSRFGVHLSFSLVGVCYALAALVPWIRSKYCSPGAGFGAGGMVILEAWMTGRVLTTLPVYFEAEQYHVVDIQSGREGSLAVLEDERSRVLIMDNQYTLGGTWVTLSLRRQAYNPLLLHPEPARVAFIGLGTGITASGALEHKAVEEVTAVELSKLVARAAALHFHEFNHGICSHPKAKVLVEDAPLYLRASAGTFDVKPRWFKGLRKRPRWLGKLRFKFRMP